MQEESGFLLKREDIEEFLREQQRKGSSPGTIARYRNALGHLYEDLPGNKRIQDGVLESWRKTQQEKGLSPSTINVYISACNAFLNYMGHREYLLDRHPVSPNGKQSELTRDEYLSLLTTARDLGQEQLYMIVKTLGNTGVRIQDLPLLTVDTVEERKLCEEATGNRHGKRQEVHIPECLAGELLEYAMRRGIQNGSLFLAKNGKPLSRTAVAASLQQLGKAANLPEGKSTAIALRKMWQQNRASIEANLDLLVEQAMEQELEQELRTVGWDP